MNNKIFKTFKPENYQPKLVMKCDATNNISSGGFEAWLWLKKLTKEEKENLRKKNKIQNSISLS